MDPRTVTYGKYDLQFSMRRLEGRKKSLTVDIRRWELVSLIPSLFFQGCHLCEFFLHKIRNYIIAHRPALLLKIGLSRLSLHEFIHLTSATHD